MKSKITQFKQLILVLGLLTITGCNQIQINCGENSSKEILVGVDTSGSSKSLAQSYHQNLSTYLIDQLPEAHLTIYRFDSDTAEVYDGFPPETLEQSSSLLKRVLSHSTNTQGTNISKLFDAFDDNITKSSEPYLLRIYTDCGIEECTNQELDSCKNLIQKWSKSAKVFQINFIGVQDGHREKLRKICKSDNIKIVFENN